MKEQVDNARRSLADAVFNVGTRANVLQHATFDALHGTADFDQLPALAEKLEQDLASSCP